MPDHQCQARTQAGHQCMNKSHARVRFAVRGADHIGTGWFCMNHINWLKRHKCRPQIIEKGPSDGEEAGPVVS